MSESDTLRRNQRKNSLDDMTYALQIETFLSSIVHPESELSLGTPNSEG